MWENNKLIIKPTKFMNLHLTIFHIYHFVIGKLQIHFWAMVKRWMVKWWMVKWCNGEIKFSVVFYQIIRKKLVPNYQTNPKYIFGRKKQNGPITSTFGPILDLTYSSYDFKVWKFTGLVSSNSFFKLLFAHLLPL